MILDAEEKVGVTPSLLPVAGRFLGGALMGLIVPCPSKRKKNIFFVCNFWGKSLSSLLREIMRLFLIFNSCLLLLFSCL